MRRRLGSVVLAAVAVAAVTGAGACSDDGGGDLAAFCATAEAFAVDNPASALDRYDPEEPAAAAAGLREAGRRLDAWATDAPSEVDDDVALLADAMGVLADEFEAPPGATPVPLGDRVAEVEEASARVVEFTRDRCEVDLEPVAAP